MLRIAIWLAAALSLSTTVFATTLTGNYSVTETYSPSSGGPSISYDLNNSSFSESLSLGTETNPTPFFTASPAGSCFGGGCHNNTETDVLTINFTGLSVLGVTIPNLTETATFMAKYSGSELSCAVGDGVSPSSGQTDCLVWQGATNTWNGSNTLTYNLGNGDNLDIFLYNATDWSITPQIAFEVVPAPVPEPASLGLMATALAGLGLIRRRRNAAA